MFNSDFYPTPTDVIYQMIELYDLDGKTVLEPSAGKGNIIDVLKSVGANVLCCELNEDLATIASKKARLIERDFLNLTSEQISHVEYIVMNPPFSVDAQHINHAWNIAPAGCQIVALCNYETINNIYSKSRKELQKTIENYGFSINIGECFSVAERRTNVEVGLIRLTKAGSSEDFNEYFTDEEDEEENQENGLMSYNAIRDVVQRYVNAVKLYDDVLSTAVKMNLLTDGLGVKDLVFTCNEKDVPTTRDQFAKELQKKSWSWIIKKLNLEKYATRGLKEDINKFVEQQKSMKFTMKNIYKMLDVIVQTTSQRMDKALLEVFDTLTKHHHENRWSYEGWKTNSHYLVNQKFIKPYLVGVSWSGGGIDFSFGRHSEELEDMQKALCYLTGTDYNLCSSFYNRVSYRPQLKQNGIYVIGEYNSPVSFETQAKAENFIMNNPNQGYEIELKPEFGKWFDWGFFEVKVFKKGTGHFKFKDENVWSRFNQHIARIKGYPLPESKKAA